MQVNKKISYRGGKLQVKYNSPVILTFVIISTIALVLSTITNGVSNYYLFSVYRTSYKDLLGFIRIFSHVLGHSGFQHYYGNMIFILLLGPILEEKYGTKNMLMLILITAFVTGVYNIIFNPNVILLGASGIVYMLMILVSIVNIEHRKIPLTLILVFTIFLGKEVFLSIIINDDVARFAHILGGMCGGCLGYILNKN